MPTFDLDFEVDGEKQLSRFFELALQRFDDFRPIFADWGEDFRRRQHSVFAGEGAFEGRSRWQELSPRYREWKEIRYPGRGILERTQRMRLSLTDKTHPDHVEEATQLELAIGTRVSYAIYHQRGGAKLPQRKVIELTPPQKLDWVQIARRITWEAFQEQAVEARIRWETGWPGR